MKPIRVTGDPVAVLGDTVNKLVRKFEYPDNDTISPAAEVGAGGGMFTVAVAASDASDISKDKADLLATGAADEQTLMGGMGQIYTAGGGRLIISEGNYECEAGIIIVGYSASYEEPMIFQGMGEATRINLSGTGSPGVLVAEGSKIRDMFLGPEGGG